MNKIFLENLPRWEKGESNVKAGNINWKSAIGYKVKFIYEDIEDEVTIIDYNKNSLDIKYKNENISKIGTSQFKKCQLGNILGIITDDFKVEIGQVFKDDKRDITIIDREYRYKNREDGKLEKRKYYKYKCTKCGYNEGWINEGNLLSNKGCSCCSGRTVVEGINDIATTNPEMVKFFANPEESKLYTKGSSKKIQVKCPDCGTEKDILIPINKIYSRKYISCSKCGDGQKYPNKFAFNLLEQLNIDFSTEYSPDWCVIDFKDSKRKCKYDFYFKISNNKYILEMDGGWHNKDNKMSGLTKEESQYIDKEKDKLANEHNIEVIRIDCEFSDMEYIKNNILNSKLSCLFDLNNVDWFKCEEFALKSRVKEACEIKRDNPEYTTTQIGEIMNAGVAAIRSYLKKGTVLGWCEYNPKEELRKTQAKNTKHKHNNQIINKKQLRR